MGRLAGDLTRMARVAAVAAAMFVMPIIATGLPGMGGQAHAEATRITEIVVQGNQRIESGTVRTYMLLMPGMEYDPEVADASLKQLFATGLFA
ncbi:MAG: outer membrane protein assembly factor BamA, partial [Pseudomonadota bacterium]